MKSAAHVALALAFALIVALPGVTAYHGADGALDAVVDTATLAGDVRAEVRGGHVGFAYADSMTWTLEGGRVVARVFEVPLRAGLLESSEPREIARIGYDHPRVSLVGAGHAFNALVSSEGNAGAMTLRAADATVTSRAPGPLAPFGEARHVEALREAYAPSSSMPLASAKSTGGGVLTLEGDFVAFVYDATLTLSVPGDSRNYPVGLFADENRVRFVVAQFKDARLTIASSAGPAFLAGDHVAWRTNGTAVFEDAHGRAAAGGDVRAANGAPLTLEGVLTGDATPQHGRLRVKGNGDVTAITVGVDRLAMLKQAVPAAAGIAALLGALAYVRPTLKYALAARLFARFRGAAALENTTRDAILAYLRAHPAASVDEVAAETRLAWSTAAYHLRVLEREGFIRSTRAGRHVRFTLAGAHKERAATVLMRQASAARIAHLVRDRSGLSQKEIASLAGVAPSTANTVLKRLTRAGLVIAERRERCVRYAVGPAWREL